ncbi:hypothetical protein PVK06_021906 [Gossypium arboreum]|uniref:Uncharacterized protein n=1 Tax=Gossypium arboreum TaxID=29729 RepID=A0ABR0PR98_GOSAR|nr:hypothetical protein PVK06_021906 [Gossypium arboreum]
MKNNMDETTFNRQQFPVLYSPSRVLAILVHWWLPEENEGNAGVASMIVISTALPWEPFVLELPLETASFSAKLLLWHCWHFRNAVSTPIIIAELLLQSLQYQLSRPNFPFSLFFRFDSTAPLGLICIVSEIFCSLLFYKVIMASEDGQDNDEILLHLYMHDYFIKNNMHETAASLRREASVPDNSVQIDHPQGILKEWWSTCSDIILKEYSEGETYAQMSDHMMQTEENQNTDDMLQQQQDSVGNTSTPVRNSSPGLSGESENKAFFFGEGRSLNCSTEEVLCCDFSSDGKLLAIAGREEKVVFFSSQDFKYFTSLKLISVFFLQVLFWNTEDHNKFVTGESHSLPISDVRFKPNSTMVATSSYDKTVQIWDSAEAGKSPLKLQGHGDHVLSLDFHPRRMNLLCSSDRNNEIRFWDINQGSWTHIFKGATKQVRFEPRNGKLLATSSGNVVNVFDVQTYKLYAVFKEHDKEVQSICWDPDGKHIISISEDSARLWSVSERKSLHELSSTGNIFQCCTFHPWNWKFWIIGGYRSFELWNPFESNKTLTIDAHKELVSSLATSIEPEMVASTSYDKYIGEENEGNGDVASMNITFTALPGDQGNPSFLSNLSKLLHFLHNNCSSGVVGSFT